MTSHKDWDPNFPKVYLEKLSGNTTCDKLESAFTKFGCVKNAWISNPPGYGCVQFEHIQHADNAVRVMDGEWLDGVQINAKVLSGQSLKITGPGSGHDYKGNDGVEPSPREGDANSRVIRKSPDHGYDINCTIFVKHLSSKANEGDLKIPFGKYGSVKKVTVAKNPPGFAYVEYENPGIAEYAAVEMNGRKICGDKITTEMASSQNHQPKSGERNREHNRPGANLHRNVNVMDKRVSGHRDMNVKCKVIVEDLKSNTTLSNLEVFFKDCGTLKGVWLNEDPTSYAYVEFENPQDAEDAAQYMDRKRILGIKVRVRMASSQSRESPHPEGSRDAGRKDESPGSSATKRKKTCLSSPSRRRSRSSSPRSPRRSSRSSAVPSSSSRRERSRSRSRSPLRRTVPSSVTWITDHRKMDKNCKVFIGNLGSGASHDDLEASFREYGNLKKGGVTNVWISSIPFGHGFVAYGQRKDAETAVQQTKGLLNIRDSMVLVELCDNGPSSSATSSRPANSSARPHSPPPRSDTPQPLKPFNFEKIWPIRPEIMKVLLEKFLINPPEVKSDWITLFNRIKEALTHYEDNFFEIDRKRNPSWNLPYLKQFAAMVFMDWDFLRGEKDNFHLHYAAFQKYERSLPTYGAIMLTEDFEKVLLVKGRQGNWGFPKGKIAHKDEEPAVCANREVNEEIGYKIAAKLNVDHFFETSLNGRPTGLFLIHGIPEMTDFKRRNSEITGIKWVLVRELESAVSEEDLISPFIKLIRDWIDKEERKKSDLSDRAFPMVSES